MTVSVFLIGPASQELKSSNLPAEKSWLETLMTWVGLGLGFGLGLDEIIWKIGNRAENEVFIFFPNFSIFNFFLINNFTSVLNVVSTFEAFLLQKSGYFFQKFGRPKREW